MAPGEMKSSVLRDPGLEDSDSWLRRTRWILISDWLNQIILLSDWWSPGCWWWHCTERCGAGLLQQWGWEGEDHIIISGRLWRVGTSLLLLWQTSVDWDQLQIREGETNIFKIKSNNFLLPARDKDFWCRDWLHWWQWYWDVVHWWRTPEERQWSNLGDLVQQGGVSRVHGDLWHQDTRFVSQLILLSSQWFVVQEYQGLWEDDTALNALVLYCCFNPFFSF